VKLDERFIASSLRTREEKVGTVKYTQRIITP